jgi:hypothetical protein
MSGSDGGKRAAPPQPAAATSPPDAALAAVVAVAADAAPPPPPIRASIRVTVGGPPTGTRVTLPDGMLLGTVPGALDVPQGDAPLTLRFSKDGYLSVDSEIVPARDLVLEVLLKKKRSARPVGDKPPDEIGDF